MVKASFDLKTYLQSGVRSGKGVGIRDPLRTAGARIEYARRFGIGSQPLTPGEQVEAKAPKGQEQTAFNAWQASEAAKRAKLDEDKQKKWQGRQEFRNQRLEDMTPEQRLEYKTQKEGSRLNQYAATRNKTGKSLQSIEEYQRGEGKWYQEEQTQMGMMSPAEQEARIAQLKTYTDAADYALWKMADAEQTAFASPEDYVTFRGYMAAWMEARGTEAQDLWDVPALIGNLAHDDIIPTPISGLIGIGALRNGQVLTEEEAAGFSIDLSSFEGEGFPNPTLKITVDAEGNPILTVSRYLNADGTAVQELVIGNEDYRVRDFTVPQILPYEEAQHYMDLTGGSPDSLYIIQETTNEAGERGLSLVGQVVDGWTINFNEDGTRSYTDNLGQSYDQVGYDALLAKQEADNEALTTEYNNSKLGVVVADALINQPQTPYVSGLFITKGENGQSLARAGYPSNLYQSDLGDDAKIENINGRDYVSIYDTVGEGKWDSYPLPMLYDDTNLPDFITKQTLDGQDSYFIDLSTPEGVMHLVEYYPDEFFTLLRNGGENDNVDNFLREELKWSNKDIANLFYKPKNATVYSPETINNVAWWDIVARTEYGIQQIGNLIQGGIEGVGQIPVVGEFLQTAGTGVMQGLNTVFGTTPDFLADISADIVGGFSASDKAYYGNLADQFKANGPLTFFNADTQQIVASHQDTPEWLRTGFEVAAMFVVPVAGKFKLRISPMMRSIEGGGLKFITRFEQWTDLKAAAKFNDYQITGLDNFISGVADKFWLKVDNRLIELKSLKEADNLFRYGNIYGDTIGLSTDAKGALQVELSNGTKINILDNKPAGEILDYLAKTHPGRLGGGFLNFLKAKGYKLTNGKISDITRPTELATTEQVMALTKEAIETGAISLDQLFRSINQIRLWGKSSAGGIAGYYTSLLESNFGNISRILGIRDGIITKGVKALDGAPLIEGKASLAWHDVFQFYKYYEFENASARGWIESAHKIIDKVVEQGEKHGVEIVRKDLTAMFELAEYFPRGGVIGKQGLKFKFFRRGVGFPKGKMSAEKHRVFEFMKDSLDEGYLYDSPRNVFGSYIEQMYVRMSNADAMELWLKADLSRVAGSETEMGATLVKGAKIATKDVIDTQKLINEIKLMQRYANYSPEPAMWAMIKRQYPDIWKQLKKIHKQAKAPKVEEVKPIEPVVKQVIGEPEASRAITPVIETVDNVTADAFDKVLLEAQALLREKAGLKTENIKQRASAAEAFRHVGFTETTGNRVGLWGEIYDDVVINGERFTGKQIMTKWEKTFGTKPNPILKFVSDLNRNLVMFQTIDLMSVSFIQLIYTLGLDTRANLKALFGQGKFSNMFLESSLYGLTNIGSEKALQHFIRVHSRTLDWAVNEGLIMESTGGEFFTKGTLLEKVMSDIPILGTVPLKIAELAGRGFGAGSFAARTLIAENLEREWVRAGGTRTELAEFANNVTGVTSSQTIGVSATQRMIESASLFAPRYLRANLLMMNRMMPIGTRFSGIKRGVPAKMLVETIGGTVAGWTAAYVALCVAMGQEPRLKPWPESVGEGAWKGDGSKAFTIEVNGQYIGVLGGFPFSYAKMWAGIIAQAQDSIANGEPMKMFSIDFSSLSAVDQSLMQNNPLYRFMAGRSAPGLSLIREIVTGRDYLGYSLSGYDYLEELANNFMPFTLQSIVTQNPPANLQSFFAGWFGLRNFPATAWESVNVLFEDLVAKIPDSFLSPEQLVKRENGTLVWTDLTKWQKEKMKVDYPELADAITHAQEVENGRRTAGEKQWASDIEANEKTRLDANNADFLALQNTEDTEIVTIVDYRKHLSDNTSDFYAVSDDIKRRYPDLYASFEQAWQDKSETAPQFDIAYNEYYDIIFNEKYTLPGGTPDYTAIDAAIAAWVEKWDKDGSTGFLSMIQDLKRYGFAGQNPIELKLWEDKEFLSTYWNLPQGKEREDFLKSPLNVDFEARLAFWGWISTVSPAAEAIVRQWCAEYNVPESTIPALSAFILPDEMATKYSITDPSKWRTYTETPGTVLGWDKRWYLKNNPEIYNYLIGEGLITETINFALVPKPEEHALILAYDDIKGDNAEDMRKMWRCTNEAGDAAVSFYKGIQPMYGGNACRRFLSRQGQPAVEASAASQYFTGTPSEMPINLPRE